MPRPESNKLNPKDFVVKPDVPESKSSGESFGQKIRRYVGEKVGEAANVATGGALGTTNRARRDMNYYHEDDGK